VGHPSSYRELHQRKKLVPEKKWEEKERKIKEKAASGSNIKKEIGLNDSW
jgi:hypothetical protein